jgi:hypothetical protein
LNSGSLGFRTRRLALVIFEHKLAAHEQICVLGDGRKALRRSPNQLRFGDVLPGAPVDSSSSMAVYGMDKGITSMEL